MKVYTYIREDEDILEYLQKRDLVSRYKKAKMMLLLGVYGKLDFKERKPKGSEIFSFRINNQFRVFCIETDDGLTVVEINNHQNF